MLQGQQGVDLNPNPPAIILCYKDNKNEINSPFKSVRDYRPDLPIR